MIQIDNFKANINLKLIIENLIFSNLNFMVFYLKSILFYLKNDKLNLNI